MLNPKWLAMGLCFFIFWMPAQSAVSASCHYKTPPKNFGLCGSTGPVFFGASVSQGSQPGNPGYVMGLGGVGFLVEASWYRHLTLGLAISGYMSKLTPALNPGNQAASLKTMSGSPAVYAGLQYDGAFFYVTLATGVIKYNSSRVVSVGNQTATARFEARQNSLRGRLGYALPFRNLEITPLMVTDAVIIRKGAYNETGAGTNNLTVSNGESTALQTAFGVRFAEISEPDVFYPEFHFFSFSDSKPTRLKVISRFLDGIPPVVLDGRQVGSSGYNVGGSISTTILGRGMYLVASYDYEGRQKTFASHSVFLRVKANF